MYRKLSLISFFALLLSACDDEYKKGYSDGKSDGYKEGKEVGYKEGHQVGYEEGKADGYKEGHQVGYTEGHDAGYWEGTQFLVQDNALPTAGLGILIALCLIMVVVWYKVFFFFFKEKLAKRKIVKQIKQLEKSKLFETQIAIELQKKQIQEEIANLVGITKSEEFIRRIFLDSLAETDEIDSYKDFYVNIITKIADSNELSNEFKLKLYSEVLEIAKRQSFQKDDENNESSNQESGL